MPQRSFSNFSKEFFVDLVDNYFTNSDTVFCDLIHQFFTVDQVDLLFAWVGGFFFSCFRESASGD